MQRIYCHLPACFRFFTSRFSKNRHIENDHTSNVYCTINHCLTVLEPHDFLKHPDEKHRGWKRNCPNCKMKIGWFENKAHMHEACNLDDKRTEPKLTLRNALHGPQPKVTTARPENFTTKRAPGVLLDPKLLKSIKFNRR